MDFRKFYEEQGDYEAFRSDPARQAEYKMKAEWKISQLLSLVPGNMISRNILEVGCAMGILLNNIAGRLSIKEYVGLDISLNNIESARKLFPDGVFIHGTLEELKIMMPSKFSYPRFDLVVLSDIIEHIPEDLEFMKIVNGISDHVLVNLPLEKSFRNRNRNYGEDDPSGHLRCYDETMASNLVREAGFEIVKSFTLNPLFDRSYFEFYKRQRKERIRKKSFPRRVFWTIFYAVEDNLKMISKSLYEKINGTNYFALLKSKQY
jgi:SAM-dependent methyltransferase